MAGKSIAIDVSGAPAHEREVQTIVAGLVGSLLLVVLSGAALMIVDPDGRLPTMISGLCHAGAFAVGLLVFFGLPVLFTRGDERRIQLALYGVTLAQAKRRVFERLHRPWWAHPDLWAWISLAAAFAAPIAILRNEHAIVVGLGGVDAWGNPRWDNTLIEAVSVLLALALLLNAARLYTRGHSLWAYSVPVLMYFVGLPALALLYFWGVWTIISFATGHPENAIAPGSLSHDDVEALLYGFGFFPSVVLGFASLQPGVRRFYGRIADRYWRLMQVVQLPSAKQALRRDRRRPILYLRSFLADQAWVWDGNSGKTSTSRRLEDSIAAPLRELGPLVAIGKPRELAVTGAARAYYSDDQWQAAIADLMERAGFIVAVIGPTEGLAWELATLRARNHIGKTIWVLPPDQTNATLLRAKLRDVFAQTPYEGAAQGAELSAAMVVYATGADQVAVISSAKNTTGEYEAAIHAAVYGLTRHLIEPGRAAFGQPRVM